MKIETFIAKTDLGKIPEYDRAVLLAYFHSRENGVTTFSMENVSDWLYSAGFSRPNKTRLRDKLRAQKYVVAGAAAGDFRIQQQKQHGLDAAWGAFFENEEISHDGTVIPESVYKVTPSYIKSLADQINACYSANAFDGCAVLMRRLLEILLILSMEKKGEGHQIKGSDGAYLLLEKIVDRAKSSSALALSRNSKDFVDTFRKLGNFSAHKIYYLCKRDDIKRVAFDYRALVQELLFKSELIQ